MLAGACSAGQPPGGTRGLRRRRAQRYGQMRKAGRDAIRRRDRKR